MAAPPLGRAPVPTRARAPGGTLVQGRPHPCLEPPSPPLRQAQTRGLQKTHGLFPPGPLLRPPPRLLTGRGSLLGAALAPAAAPPAPRALWALFYELLVRGARVAGAEETGPPFQFPAVLLTRAAGAERPKAPERHPEGHTPTPSQRLQRLLRPPGAPPPPAPPPP